MSHFTRGVVLVTGGASGIGEATVRRLRAAGSRVAVVDLREPVNGAADLSLVADVADPATWTPLLQRVVDELGGLDAVHLNAGVTCDIADITAVDDATYRRLVGVNVDQVFFGLRAAVRVMEPRGGGSIVVTASLAGLTGFGVDPVYTLTKHAVVGLVRGAAANLAARGVTVTAVCPGIVDTPLIAASRHVLVDAGFPMLEADDIAATVLQALATGRPGDCFAVQPGRAPEPYRFAGIPGPRVAGREGALPPL